MRVPTPQRYTTSAVPTAWKLPGQDRLIPAAILDAVEDGQDRVLLAWPFAPINSFAAAALALRESRAGAVDEVTAVSKVQGERNG